MHRIVEKIIECVLRSTAMQSIQIKAMNRCRACVWLHVSLNSAIVFGVAREADFFVEHFILDGSTIRCEFDASEIQPN